MQTAQGRLAAMVRAAGFLAVALTLASPASAQFGGLKKKVKAATTSEAGSAAAEAAGVPAAAPAAAPGATGGTVVLSDDVVADLINGLKAADAERQAAKKADTPYGRYHTALAAYEAAKPKCDAAMQGLGTRMVADNKLGDRYNGYVEKMSAAQVKGDQKAAMAWNDSAMALIDASCLVKQPEQPSSYYEDKRKVDAGAEESAVKNSKLSRSDYAQGMERVEMTLRDAPPTDLSPSEKSAIEKRSGELKKLLGLEPVPAARTEKAAVTPAPTPAPAAPAGPAMTKEQSDLAACMTQNSQKHEKEVIALGERMAAAQEAGNMDAVMAMADTLARIQSGNCNR
jgi:hypothetical protein